MAASKRKKKIERKKSAEIPTWLFDKDVPIALKREIEDALARHAADNGIAVGSARFKSLMLQDLCASLKLVCPARWSAVEPGMINASAQPGTKVLAACLLACKKKKGMMEQMVAEHKAAAASASQGHD